MRNRILLAVLVSIGALGCDRDDTTSNPPRADSTQAPAPHSTVSDDRSNPGAGVSTTRPGNDTAYSRDNTGVNTRDRTPSTLTADQAGQASSDVDIAAQIRQKVTDTKMSISAQNAKIIVIQGKVTLRGPVKSSDEKEAVGRLAASVVGPANVDNQLEISP